MNILIVYASTEGQTRKISEHAAEYIRRKGHDATVFDSQNIVRPLGINAFDAIIIAASVHQECHQDAINHFVVAHRDTLNSKPNGFISVSLSAVLDHGQEDAQRYVDVFRTTTDWEPGNILLLGGALRHSEYDYFKQQIVKHIVLKRGGAENSDRDYEFTDWDALTRFLDVTLALTP